MKTVEQYVNNDMNTVNIIIGFLLLPRDTDTHKALYTQYLKY